MQHRPPHRVRDCRVCARAHPQRADHLLSEEIISTRIVCTTKRNRPLYLHVSSPLALSALRSIVPQTPRPLRSPPRPARRASRDAQAFSARARDDARREESTLRHMLGCVWPGRTRCATAHGPRAAHAAWPLRRRRVRHGWRPLRESGGGGRRAPHVAYMPRVPLVTATSTLHDPRHHRTHARARAQTPVHPAA